MNTPESNPGFLSGSKKPTIEEILQKRKAGQLLTLEEQKMLGEFEAQEEYTRDKRANVA